MRFVWPSALLVVVSLASAASALAALPAYYERTREMAAVLGNMEVMRKLGEREIRGIEANGPGTYRVWSDVCSLDVKLVGKARTGPPIAGPWQFEVRPGQPHCKE